MADDNDAVFIDYNWLAEAKLLQTGRHFIHRLVVYAGIVLVRTNVADVP